MVNDDKVYVVIDVGCHECGVNSVPIGIYHARDFAEQVAHDRDQQTRGWRDGGQTYAEVFEMAWAP